MNNQIITIENAFLHRDFASEDLTESERKAFYHRCLYLSHQITSIKRLLIRQTAVLKDLGRRSSEK
jgi:hypothetical protein